MLGWKNLYTHTVEEPRSVRRNIRRLIRPVVELVVAEQPHVGHENARVHVDAVHRVEVVAAVSFGQVAVGISQIPLAARRAGVVARCGFRIQSELRHHASAHIVVVKIAANAKLRELHFVGAKDFARSTDRVVFRMAEIINVIDIRTNFRREKFRVDWNLFGPRISIQPCEVGERKGLTRWRFACGQLAFVSGLRLNNCEGGVLRKQIWARCLCGGRCARSSHSRS